MAEQNLDLERLNQLYAEEEKFVVVMEKMVESQTEDHSILDKYSHQDNLTIKVNNPYAYGLINSFLNAISYSKH